MRLARATALVLVGILAPITSCKQGEGDRCQLDSDCGDGLVCCVDPARIHEGGICRPEGKCDSPPLDSGTDSALTDMLPDEGLVPDLKPSSDLKPTHDTTPTGDTTGPPDQQSGVDSFPLSDQSVPQG